MSKFNILHLKNTTLKKGCHRPCLHKKNQHFVHSLNVCKLMPNLSMLIESVTQYHPVVIRQNGKEGAFLAVKRLYDGLIEFEPDVLYIGKMSDLADDTLPPQIKNIILISENLIADTFQDADANVINIAQNVDPNIIAALIEAMLIKYHRFMEHSSTLLNAAIKSRGIQDILDCGYKIFNNPIFVVDSAYKLVAVIKGGEVHDEPLKDLIQCGFFTQSHIQLIKKNDIHKKILSSNSPVKIEKDDYFFYARIVSNINIENKSIGHLGVIFENDRKIDDFDIDLMAKLRDVLALEMEKSSFIRNTKGLEYEFFIADLLDGMNADAVWIMDRMKSFGLKENCHNYVINIDPSKSNEIVSLSLLRKEVENILSDSKPLIYHDKLVIFISRDASDPTLKQALAGLAEICKHNQLYGAMSNCFSSLAKLEPYYKQTLKIIDLGTKLGMPPTLFQFRDFIQWYIYDISVQTDDVMTCCHPDAKTLYKFDLENNTNYLQTIYHFLINERNILLTAKAMYLHRNSLKYRLKKIDEIVHMDFENYIDRQWIISSIRLLDYKSKLNKLNSSSII